MASKSQTKATQKYNGTHYDSFVVRLRKDGTSEVAADEVKSAAAEAGESLNVFIMRAIRERVDKLNSNQ